MMQQPEPIADNVVNASIRLGIGKSKLYEQIKAGKIRAAKIGRRRLITRQEQQRWLDSLHQMTT